MARFSGQDWQNRMQAVGHIALSPVLIMQSLSISGIESVSFSLFQLSHLALNISV